MKKILKSLLLILIISTSIFSLKYKANANGAGKIKIYASVMKENNYPITMSFYEKGTKDNPIREYELNKSNNWMEEDSIPSGEYDVYASMVDGTDAIIKKYPITRTIEVKDNQEATGFDNGAFTIIQCDNLYEDDFQIFLIDKDENGEFDHGEFTLNDAKIKYIKSLEKQDISRIENMGTEDGSSKEEAIKDIKEMYEKEISNIKKSVEEDKHLDETLREAAKNEEVNPKMIELENNSSEKENSNSNNKDLKNIENENFTSSENLNTKENTKTNSIIFMIVFVIIGLIGFIVWNKRK